MSNVIHTSWNMINETAYIVQTMNKQKHANHLKASDILENMRELNADMNRYDNIRESDIQTWRYCTHIIDNILKLIQYRYDTIKSLNT